jgi:hypothetical protein
LWVTAKRIIGGSAYRSVEKMSTRFLGTDTDNAEFLDSFVKVDNRQTVESIAYTNPAVVTLTSHGYSDGDTVTFRTSDCMFSDTCIHYEDYIVSNSTANTFQLQDDQGSDVDLTGFNESESVTVGKKQSVVNQLNHLEGETVNVFADGVEQPSKTVSNGQITLDSSASRIIAGVGYTSILELFPPGSDGELTTVSSKPKRTREVLIQLYKTLGVEFGFDNYHDIPFLDSTTPLGRAAPLVTGFTEKYPADVDYERQNGLKIRTTQAYPCTIVGVFQEVEFVK